MQISPQLIAILYTVIHFLKLQRVGWRYKNEINDGKSNNSIEEHKCKYQPGGPPGWKLGKLTHDLTS
jgi:hypothetical protein